MKLTLYDIGQRYQELIDLLTELHDPENEAQPGHEERLEAVQHALDENEDEMMVKITGYIAVIRMLKEFSLSAKAERDRLYRRQVSAERSSDWLKNAVAMHLKARGLKNVKVPIGTIGWREGVATAVVDDEFALPEGLYRVDSKIVPDLTAIRKAIQEGGEGSVPGAHLKEAEPVATLR